MSTSQRIVQLGFMPLIDAAPVVAAARLGFDRKHGVSLRLQRQASWAAIRDKLLSGELDAVHALSGLVHGVQFGIGGVQADMAALLTLNHNGQAIALSQTLAQSISSGVPLREALAKLPRRPVFAQTFPTGTHAMWLYYWLAANGMDPLTEIQSIIIPPPRMADALAAGELDGFCAGEPWGLQAEVLNAGRRVIRSGDIWPGHPEKVLACRRDFIELEPEAAVGLTAAILEACRWLDEPLHRREAAVWIADSDVIGLPADRIAECLEMSPQGSSHELRFHSNGVVNMPYLSDGLWFASQFIRWGMLPPEVTAEQCRTTIAAVQRLAEYKKAAWRIGVEIPARDSRPSTLFDGVEWPGDEPISYARQFPIRRSAVRP
jgi:ABC-type nitrate/sulfonate/bicarbonate transport system substrate-binding protein